MSRPPKRYDLTFRRGNLAALLLLCVLAGASLLVRQLYGHVDLGSDPPVLSERVDAITEKIDPNTAGGASLQRLRGIGPARAKAIVAARPFSTLRELIDKVDGVGEGILQSANHIDLPVDTTE